MMKGPSTVVYHPRIGREIADVMRAAGVPGTVTACSSEAEMAGALVGADVLMATHCDLEPVMANPELQWIQSLASGVEDWMGAPGPPRCPITRMSGVYEHYMAEYVLGFLLMRTQEIDRVREAQAARAWIPFEKGSLKGATMGVAGMGYVGSAVARCAAAFEMNVWGLRRTVDRSAADPSFRRVFGSEDRAEFFAGLDVLVLALPIAPGTVCFLDEEALRTLPSSAILFNISRGGLVDEAAMARALAAGELAGAVLDTFSVEPLPADSALWSLPNVTVTPHNAGAVHADEVGAVCARNLKEFVAGRLPEPLVDLSRGY
jgi:phosphoglycerate dehydrogenase-like enzyme